MAQRRMTPAEVRDVQLQVLDAFASWCDVHGLEVQLAFGSLLGAVRHQGFIPWDDDIDLAMPRADFERFCGEFASSPVQNLTAGSLTNTPDWPLGFAKVWDTRTLVEENTHLPLRAGVGIDVFPIDQVSRRPLWRSFQTLGARAARGTETLSAVRSRSGRARHKAVAVAIAGPVARRIGTSNIAKFRTRLARLGRGEHVSIPVGPYDWSVPSNSMVSTHNLEFEGRTLHGPADAPAVLTAIYGDYLQPPPASSRVTHHAATAWWRE